ncbi:MAG: Vacuolar protein-sorting-associated protein 24 [Phylliscum demangeonii]|nr:MAG: Vacuolar protein-sorting-associated protein 24 [Phylliscum demangeonii]
MDSLKSIFFKPDPSAQVRKCNSLIRCNVRSLERDISTLKALDSKTRALIVQTSRRAQRNPSQGTQAAEATRIYARELIRIRRQSARLATSRAQLESVGMQVREAFSVRKIEGSIRASTGIMKDVNALVRLPQLTDTMRELGQELVKAGVIEDMVGDLLPDESLLDADDDLELEADAEVDRILGEVLHGRTSAVTAPTAPAAAAAVAVADRTPADRHAVDVTAPPRPTQEEEDAAELSLAQMRGRLEALKS